MGRNFENHEIASGRRGVEPSNDKLTSRLARLAFSVAAAAAAVALPKQVEADVALNVESVKFVGTAKGKIVNGVFAGDATPDGLFTDTKVRIKINLEGIFTKDFLKELEGEDVEFDLDGEIKNGVYRGKVTPKGHIVISDCAPRPRSCERRADCKEPVRGSAAKPTRPPLSPEPGDAESELSGLVRLLKPFDPGTFYADRPETGSSMGQGHPRGFDVEKDNSVTFFVTGDKSGLTRVSIELYPWAPADEKKRPESANVKAKITIDGEKYEIIPQPLPKGKMLPSSKTGDEALLDAPIRLAAIPIPPGTHEITLSSADSRFRAVLRGAKETARPDVDAGIERPFEKNPNAPPEFYMNARVVTAADQPSGYRLETITKSPVRLEQVYIERIQNSTLVRVRLVMENVAYVSEKPLMPHMDHRALFTRVIPPARSTDPDAPGELPLNVRVTQNAQDGYEGNVDDLQGITCLTIPPANLHCWKASEDESRVRAFRARLDTRPGPGTRHYFLRRY